MRLEFLQAGVVTDLTDVEAEVLASELEEQGDELLALDSEPSFNFEDTHSTKLTF